MRLCRVVTVPMTFVTLLRRQMQAIAESGIDLTIVSSPGAGLDSVASDAGVRRHAIRMARDVSPFADARSLIELTRFFKAERFDMVHSSTQKAGLLCALAARLAGVPIRLHTFTGQRWVELRGLARRVVRTTDRVIASLDTRCYADSRSQTDFLVSEGIVPAAKISVIASGSISGVDLARFDAHRFAKRREAIRQELGIHSDALVVLFVGRLTRDKGIAELLDAFSMLRIPERNVQLVLVGPRDQGDLSPRAESLIACDSRIRCVGYSLEPERFMAVADVLCLPSYREGFGSVIVEAAAMAVPAVATRIAGLTDAVADGMTGILVNPKDAVSLRAGLTAVLTDNGMRERMGEMARKRAVRLFDDRLVNARVVREYELLFTERDVHEEEEARMT